MLSRSRTLWGFVLLVGAVLLACVALLTQAVHLSPTPVLATQPAVASARNAPAAPPIQHWQLGDGPAARSVEAFWTPGARIPANPLLGIPEPDMLPSYARYNQLMQEQRALAEAARRGQLQAVLADGRTVPLHSQRLTLGDFPAIFWFQLFVGAAGALTGAAIYSFSQRSRATRYFLLTGLGYLCFAPSAAVYSSRELILDGSLIRLLSGLNHFGALLFTVSLAALLWCYPQPIRRWPVPALLMGSGLVLWLADQWQWLPEIHWASITVLGFFALALLFAVIQYVQARHHPVNRASFRWFILSILLGTGLFAGFILIPVALQRPVQVDQGWMFGAFLLMYWGLALGLMRYRLFELEDWWFAIWTWFLGGVAVILIDVLLMATLSLSSNEALVWALAIAGWLYFPVRQKLLQHLTRNTRHDPRVWLRQALPLLINLRPEVNQVQQIQQQWRQILQRVFDPLNTESCPPGPEAAVAQVQHSGESLLVQGLTTDSPALRLWHAARGRQLFAGSDVERVEEMHQLATLALSVARARDQGIRLERERIAKEIHDDLGAHLTTLLVQTPPQQQQVVQKALEDMRRLLQSMDGQDTALEDAAAQWRQETAQRVEQAGRRLQWQSDVQGECVITALTAHHIGKILREAITNALRHGNEQPIGVQLRTISRPEGVQLTLQVSNGLSRTPLPPESRHHRGLHNLQQRAESIQGCINWVKHADSFELHLQVVLPGGGG